MPIPAVKRRLPQRFRRLASAAALLVALAPAPAAAISDRIAHDPTTGLAIAGFDPVAYFLDNAAVPGDPEIEVAWRDSYWRFANLGNAAAFSEAPATYIPAYGGHSPIAIANNIARPGDPRLFLIFAGRVFLFATPQERAAFAAAPEPAVLAADAAWPTVRDTLAD